MKYLSDVRSKNVICLYVIRFVRQEKYFPVQITEFFYFHHLLRIIGHFGVKVTGHVINFIQSDCSDAEQTHCPGTNVEYWTA